MSLSHYGFSRKVRDAQPSPDTTITVRVETPSPSGAAGALVAGVSAARGAVTDLDSSSRTPTAQEMRQSDWQVVKAPEEPARPRDEITGPTGRKMTAINALNSGVEPAARVLCL